METKEQSEAVKQKKKHKTDKQLLVFSFSWLITEYYSTPDF
jgi:hypothetical protein